MNIHLIRLGGVAAGVAGVLRVLTSLLPPAAGRIQIVYLIIDVLLLFGCLGLYEFQRVAVSFLETVAVSLEMVGVSILIARDLSLLKPEVYSFAALLFAAGLDLFAIVAWRSKTLPRWILTLWILSTVIGPIGFFTPRLGLLFVISGILFGIGFAAAGVSILLPRQRLIPSRLDL